MSDESVGMLVPAAFVIEKRLESHDSDLDAHLTRLASELEVKAIESLVEDLGDEDVRPAVRVRVRIGVRILTRWRLDDLGQVQDRHARRREEAHQADH